MLVLAKCRGRRTNARVKSQPRRSMPRARPEVNLPFLLEGGKTQHYLRVN